MAVAPKPKVPPTSPVAPAKPDRTSTVVGATLIVLTALGVLTIFWEPLAALAMGAPSSDGVSEPRATSGNGGAAAASAAAVAIDAGGNS